MLRGAILLFFCVVGNSNEDGDWLKCEPKPGCSIARCDPPPGNWFENPDKLDDYSILCQKNDDPGMVTNYKDVLEELAKLKGRLERSERERSEMKAEINILERENTRMKSQMEKERNESKSTFNNALKNLEEKIENKFTSWRMKAENVSCAITFRGICYWTYVEEEWNISFARAEEICSNMASTPAHFSSEEVYNSVVEYLRSEIPSGNIWTIVWTGIAIGTNTGNVIHPIGDSYVKWHPGQPRTGSSYMAHTHVLLIVRPDPGSADQGMWNAPPERPRHGVVCQSVE